MPGANDTLTKLCNAWAEKNKVEVHIDYITSQGEKDKLTAAAEAPGGTGHDIMSHRDWNIEVHQRVLEPIDDVVSQLIKQYGPISPVAEYLAKINGKWRGVPTAVGSQVKPCCSRLDLYKQYTGLDLREMFPADDRSMDLGSLPLDRGKAVQGRLSGRPSHGPSEAIADLLELRTAPAIASSDAVDWVGALFNSYGVVMVDEKDNIKIGISVGIRQLERMQMLTCQIPSLGDFRFGVLEPVVDGADADTILVGVERDLNRLLVALLEDVLSAKISLLLVPSGAKATSILPAANCSCRRERRWREPGDRRRARAVAGVGSAMATGWCGGDRW